MVSIVSILVKREGLTIVVVIVFFRGITIRISKRVGVLTIRRESKMSMASVGIVLGTTGVGVNELMVNEHILNDGHWHLSGQDSVEVLVVGDGDGVNNSVWSLSKQISVNVVIS